MTARGTNVFDEAERYLSFLDHPRRARALASLPLSSKGRRLFWEHPEGLTLDYAHYDPLSRMFQVAFRLDGRYELPTETLGHHAPVRECGLDEFRHGVIVRFEDDSTTSFSSDFVLYHCEPAYRARHARHESKRVPNFGAKIRALRLAAGRDAVEVARAAGMAPSNYSRLEASKHRPRVETLVRIATALRVPLAALVEP